MFNWQYKPVSITRIHGTLREELSLDTQEISPNVTLWVHAHQFCWEKKHKKTYTSKTKMMQIGTRLSESWYELQTKMILSGAQPNDENVHILFLGIHLLMSQHLYNLYSSFVKHLLYLLFVKIPNQIRCCLEMSHPGLSIQLQCYM